MRQANTSGYPLTVILPAGPVDVGPGEHLDHDELIAGFTPAEGGKPAGRRGGKPGEPDPSQDDPTTPEDAS